MQHVDHVRGEGVARDPVQRGVLPGEGDVACLERDVLGRDGLRAPALRIRHGVNVLMGKGRRYPWAARNPADGRRRGAGRPRRAPAPPGPKPPRPVSAAPAIFLPSASCPTAPPGPRPRGTASGRPVTRPAPRPSPDRGDLPRCPPPAAPLPARDFHSTPASTRGPRGPHAGAPSALAATAPGAYGCPPGAGAWNCARTRLPAPCQVSARVQTQAARARAPGSGCWAYAQEFTVRTPCARTAGSGRPSAPNPRACGPVTSPGAPGAAVRQPGRGQLAEVGQQPGGAGRRSAFHDVHCPSGGGAGERVGHAVRVDGAAGAGRVRLQQVHAAARDLTQGAVR